MKANIKVLVTRINNIVVDIQGFNKNSNMVQLTLDGLDLDVNALYSLRHFIKTQDNIFIIKDKADNLVRTVGNLKISIENIQVSVD